MAKKDVCKSAVSDTLHTYCYNMHYYPISFILRHIPLKILLAVYKKNL